MIVTIIYKFGQTKTFRDITYITQGELGTATFILHRPPRKKTIVVKKIEIHSIQVVV